MRRARGGGLVTGKEEGELERVSASAVEDDGGDCWTRQVEMLFTNLMLGVQLVVERVGTYLVRRCDMSLVDRVRVL